VVGHHAPVTKRRALPAAFLVAALTLGVTPALAGRWLPVPLQAPALAAAAAVLVAAGPGGLRWLAGRCLRRPPVRLLVAALLLPLAIGALAALLAAARGGGPPLLAIGSPLETLLVGPLLAGLVEEPAWRGALQGALGRRVRAVPAWLCTGVVWYAWHRLQSPPESLGGFGGADVVGLTYVISVAVVYGWLCDLAGGAVLVPLVAHAAMHVTFTVFALGQATDTLIAVWISLAALVCWRDRRRAVSD
jgi:membrane protease YdiL (CAAX protease family)